MKKLLFALVLVLTVSCPMIFNRFLTIKRSIANGAMATAASLILMSYLDTKHMVLLLVTGITVLSLATIMSNMNSKKMPSQA